MKILIVKTSSIGDIIQSFPVVEYLKKRHPDAEIDWVVEKEYAGLLSAHPDIRRVIPVQTRKWKKDVFSWREVGKFLQELRQEKYDLLFDLQGNIKSGFITGAARSVEKIGFGKKSVAERPNLWVTKTKIEVPSGLQVQQRYLQLVQGYFGDPIPFIPQGVKLKCEREIPCVPGPKIMVACSSRWPNKKLSLTTLQELLISIEGDPFFYLVFGSEEEKKEAEQIQALFPERSTLTGGLEFAQWQQLMRKMDLVIAVDSAALALCGTTQTPSWSFFGPTRQEVYRPLGEMHKSWQGSCPYGQSFTSRCPHLRSCPTGACLKEGASESLLSLQTSLHHR